MIKRPIDDIFRDRLKNHRIEPSEEAWNKLSGNTTKSNSKRMGFYWYVAASLLIGGVLIYQNVRWGTSQYRTERSIGVNLPEEVKAVAAIDNRVTSPEMEPNLSRASSSEPVKTDPRPQAIASTVAPPRKLIKAASQDVTLTKTNKTEVDNYEQAQPEMRERSAVPSPIEKEKAEVLLAQIPVSPSATEQESRVIIVKVEEPEGMSNEKSGKFSRLFQQLKNVKSGDPVDWDEVGINPKALLVRVDERLTGADSGNPTRSRRNKPVE
ncbi:hypothetical protein [Dyadobacter tibetensis]|uniref:hypothetical protein n=1 Tax=Dyadobacter tibetensis TaxID=1211851 RepID=UPI00047224E1|nr:hypothetical protein [Dyadobacter tibetensis]